ncbi:MAG: HIRAN domain-containing protein [Streptococcaceae bacterium]|jgi:hypothetical protein|nr:HIRAN domain-containing protein [Streptococcaceae bacterium]
MKELALLWQNLKSRQWYHVGTLTFDNKYYRFEYTTKKERLGLSAAKKAGYHLHPGFPDEDKIYEQERLFASFSRRLPNMKRRDIIEKYQEFGLTFESNPMDLLQMSSGRLAADNYEFVRPIQKIGENQYSIEFYVRGMRYYNQGVQLEDLELRPDKDNEYDENAISVFSSGKKIGYVPAFYAPQIREYLEAGHDLIVTKAFFDENEEFRHKLYLTVETNKIEFEKAVSEIVSFKE